mgnify:CR=1 FL=1
MENAARVNRPTRAIVDLDAIVHNVRALGDLLPPDTIHMAVVKADGYGHGAVPVSLAALFAGATRLAVATVEEGEELREAGIEAPILLLGNLPLTHAARAIEADLSLAVYNEETLEALSSAAKEAGRALSIHIKFDTGMGRLGLWGERAMRLADKAVKDPHLNFEGIMSHFATADERDLSFALIQLERFNKLIEEVADRFNVKPIRHISNSAGTIALPEAHLDMVRTGIAIYGQYPSPEISRDVELIEAMRWVAPITNIKRVAKGTPLSYGSTHVTSRESIVATLPVGYADGYPRLLSNKGTVLVDGKRAPILGRICMDIFLIDITEIPAVKLGDEVVLLGNSGDDAITAEEIANLTGTINYEVLCSISKRVPREYSTCIEVLKEDLEGRGYKSI